MKRRSVIVSFPLSLLSVKSDEHSWGHYDSCLNILSQTFLYGAEETSQLLLGSTWLSFWPCHARTFHKASSACHTEFCCEHRSPGV